MDPLRLNGNSDQPGFVVELTRLLCNSLRYDCQFVLQSSDLYGSRLPNGSWTGLLGSIANGTYDTSLPLFMANRERLKDFDFADFSIRLPVDFATRRPNDYESFSIGWLSLPFAPEVWAVLLAAVLLLSLVVTVYQLAQSRYSGESPVVPMPWFHSAAMALVAEVDNLVEVIGGLVTSPSSTRVTGWASRFLFLCWGLALVVLIGSYTGAIFSAMLTISPSPPFTDLRSLTDCVESFRCTVGVTETLGFYEQEAAVATNDTQLGRLYSAVIHRSRPIYRPNLSALLAAVHEEKRKYFVARPDFYQMSVEAAQDCSLLLIPYTTEGSANTFVFRKGDLRARQFGSQLRWLISTGLAGRLMSKYLNQTRMCESNAKRPRNVPVPMTAVIGALLFLAFGQAVATGAFLIERLTHLLTFTQSFWPRKWEKSRL